MGRKVTDKKIEKEATLLCEKTLSLLGFDIKPKVTQKEGAVHVEIEGDDLGLLIGQYGSNLESLQLFLGMALNKKLGTEEWVHVLVDVGGWRKQREEAIRDMIEKAIERINQGESQAELPPMSPAQRRAAHLIIADEGFSSESVGVGDERRIVIKKTNA